jgi:hypothetical protein
VERPIFAFGILLVSAACLKVPQQSAGLSAVETATVTATQLQLRIYEVGRRHGLRIEAAADSIAALTPDPRLRRRALLWKTSAIPLVQEASLHNDPVIAAVDLYAFTMQHREYFVRGDGREAFGPLQSIAVGTADALEQDARLAVEHSLTTGELAADAVERLRTWASQHPIRGVELRRETLLASEWRILGIQASSLTGTVANMDRTLVGVTHRLAFVNEGLLKQVRWHAQLMADDALSDPRIDSLLAALSRASIAAGEVFDGAPALIERQQAAFFRELGADEAAAFAMLDEQRIATLGAISAERTAVLTALREERIATMAAVDSLAARSIQEAGAVATRLLLWTFGGLAVLAALAAAATFGLLRQWRALSRPRPTLPVSQ